MIRLKTFMALLGVSLTFVTATSCISQSDSEERLAMQIATVNATCPAAIDEMVTMTEMTDDGTWVTYNNVVSSKVEIDNPDLTMAQMRKYIGDMLASDSSAIEFVVLLADTGRGLRYKFRFAGDGTERNVEFDTDELLRISSPKQQ